MTELKYEIIDNLGIYGEKNSKGWTKEVNIVKWNDRTPKVDIRDWDEAHEKMGKGITLSKEELCKLRDILTQMNVEQLNVG